MESLNELVGSIILTYGNLEKTIDYTIGYYFECILNSETANFLAQIVLSKYNNMKSKIEILEDLVKRTKINDEMLNNWLSCIKDLYELNKIRNLLAHNFYGVCDGKLVKNNRNNKEEILSEESLKNYNQILNERYRQLFDSFVEIKMDRNLTWISVYPRLKFE